MIWWLGTAAVVAYVFVNAVLIIRAKMGYTGWESGMCLTGFALLTKNVPKSLYRQSREIFQRNRHSVPWLGTALLPFLLDAATAFPASLSSRLVFLHPPLLCIP